METMQEDLESIPPHQDKPITTSYATKRGKKYLRKKARSRKKLWSSLLKLVLYLTLVALFVHQINQKDKLIKETMELQNETYKQNLLLQEQLTEIKIYNRLFSEMKPAI